MRGPEDRAYDREWCRAFIDHHCVFRSADNSPVLVREKGAIDAWQFYMHTATLNHGFSQRIGLLFWDQFAEEYDKQAFQICGCETGGVPLVCALQAAAYAGGLKVNVFSARKEAKKYGLKNWLEGCVFEDLPVLLVDDVIGAGDTLTAQAKRLTEFGLTLYPIAFAMVSCKNDNIPQIKLGNQVVDPVFLYGPGEFARTEGAYIARYGRQPRFGGTII